MANLTYRQATQEAPVSTTTKNAALTSQEIDGNFKSLNDELITKAPLVSPGLSGVPTAPTATAGTNTTQLATTAFVQTGLSSRQPLDATLTALASVTTAANQLIYATGSDAFATTSLTSFGRSLIDDADAATARTTLGLGTAAVQSDDRYAHRSNNLSDLANMTVARSNLGLSNSATIAATNLNTGNTIVQRDASGNFSAGTIAANLSGNATTATTATKANALTTARTISLTGDVTGSVSFDGSANVSITATVVDDSHDHIISNVDGLQSALDLKVSKDNVVGTVSQSGGIPTGAVIERGSNANGEYVRFADGTQICTLNATLSGVTSTVVGGIYTSQDINWTFPATFTTSAIVTGRVRVGTASSWVGLGNNATADFTSANYAIKSSTAINASTGFGLCAIGRWF